jgi:3-methyladenine DNA glycosylase AlkD
LRALADPEKAKGQQRFFKTGKGQYGAGDRFIGVTVPELRAVARSLWRTTGPEELAALLADPVHECRLTALFILVEQFKKCKMAGNRSVLARFYLDHLDGVNNWDLVDSSAHYVLGPWLLEHPGERVVLDTLAASGDLWRERISIMATFAFIKAGEYGPTLALAERFLSHGHDLMHKATGWMLREVGNRDRAVEVAFLEEHAKKMPRTMLRYAIEKFPEAERQRWLRGQD